MKQESQLNEISLNYEKTTVIDCAITCSSDADGVFRKIYQITKSKIELKEYFFVILLNRSNNVIGFYKLSEGGLTSTTADQRLVFAAALKCLATGIILGHNHPSGKTNPSEQDIKLTNKFKSAGSLLEIPVLDHMIICKEGYFSFADEGLC